jgi:catalase
MNNSLSRGPVLTRHALILATASLLSLSVHAATLTRDNGAAVGDNQNSQTAGATGPALLQDVQLIQKLQRFDRERIPERVVHARGTGAHGTFTVTDGLSDLTKAKVFAPGETTPVFVRFSAVVHGNHSPETLRDPRGFATKFYTADGNWDLVGNNFPTFFIRDAIKFPDMVHAFKPDPRTNPDFS